MNSAFSMIRRNWDRGWIKIKHEILRIRVKKQDWQFGVTKEKRNPAIIISFTSYPKRFPELELCVKSLVNQNMKADRIILWLGSDTSAQQAEDLKEKYSSRGVEIIRDTTCNLLSHKKYYYAMNRFPGDIIVTADDDLIYPPDWLESLYKAYEKHPDCICARRVHRITWDEDGAPLPYISWPGDVHAKSPGHDLIATTGAGALFPPGCLGPEALNREVFMQRAGSADDLWIKIMAVQCGIKVVWAPNNMIMPTTINLRQDEELSQTNVGSGKNDTVFRDLCGYYHLQMKDFMA